MGSQTMSVTSDRIQDALYGFTRSQILFAAIDLDVFTHIHNGNNTLEKLMPLLQAEPRGVRILLDGLIGIGFLEKTEAGAYRLPMDVRKFLVQESPEYIGGMVHHCKRLYENWSMLTEAVRSGQPVGGAQSLVQLETYFSELVKGLYVSNYPTARKLADYLEMGNRLKGQHILDVAGGSAVWSIALLEKDPDSRATVLDFPTVIEVSKEYVTQHALEARYEYWPADLEVAEFPESAYDMALLANICHALGPYATEKLLLNTGKTVKPGGRVVIVDFVPDDNRANPGWPLIFGVNMLISTPEGDVFTAAQYEQWLKRAGFKSFEAQEIEPGVTVLVAQK